MVNNVEMAHTDILKYTFSQMEIAKIPLNLGLPTYTQKSPHFARATLFNQF